MVVTPVCLSCDVVTATGKCIQRSQYSERIISREHYQRKVSNFLCVVCVVCACMHACVRVYMWYRTAGKFGGQNV